MVGIDRCLVLTNEFIFASSMATNVMITEIVTKLITDTLTVSQTWWMTRWQCHIVDEWHVDSVTRLMNDTLTVSQCWWLTCSSYRYEQAYLASALGTRHGFYWSDISDTSHPGLFTMADGKTKLATTNWAKDKPGIYYFLQLLCQH